MDRVSFETGDRPDDRKRLWVVSTLAEKLKSESGPSERKNSLTIFVNIFGILFSVAIVIAAGITLTNSYQLRLAADENATVTFRSTIQRIDEQKQSLFGTLVSFAEVFSAAPAVQRNGLTMDSLLPSLLNGLSANPHILELYAGYEDGDYYEVFSLLPEDTDFIEGMNAHSNTRFAVHKVSRLNADTRVETWQFLDKDRQEIAATENQSVTYDPRLRDWYQQARVGSQNVVRTPPYVFATSPEIGLSFAKSFDGPVGGVFAADITLNQLSAFLQSIQPNTQHRILVFDENLGLLAHTDAEKVLKRTGSGTDLMLEPNKVTDLDDPVIQQTMSLFEEKGSFPIETIILDGRDYLVSVEAFKFGDQTDYILYAAPQSEFDEYITEAANRGSFVGIIVTLLSLPFAFFLARSISAPLSQLSDEAKLIQSFNLDSPITMSSRVREINNLVESMSNMKTTMRAITKYVPKALVKDILESGRSVEVGGERRTVSLLFTDVQDFTPISDSMAPEDLMVSMSEYFEELVSLIIREDGTVDKFVGDAIFAYWNAPLPTERFEYRACRTALMCRKASDDLAKQWVEQGRTGWRTRFGIHTGDAIIGNVGSSDRIDFTAIGDPVNIASRLEGLNKYYGTSVLASGPIVAACSDDILFRKVDHCLPKGAGSSIEIYEPLGLYHGPEELRATDYHAELSADWGKTLETYNKADWVLALDAVNAFLEKYPEDGIAMVYIDRITAHLLQPPPPDWDGIMRFAEK